MGRETEWSMKQIDDVYNGSAAVGAIAAWIIDQTSGFNKNKGAVRLITTVFSGVGVGGTLAYCYLYYQGVYDVGFVPSDFIDTGYYDEASQEPSYAGTSYSSYDEEDRQQDIAEAQRILAQRDLGFKRDQQEIEDQRKREKDLRKREKQLELQRSLARGKIDPRNREFPYNPQSAPVTSTGTVTPSDPNYAYGMHVAPHIYEGTGSQ